ncbi:MAG: nucleotide exchange factor GrpE [Melioribacteraceae bacterium]|nr:nucleotide exchange factor GrpE [Melioribacteraceae bacterium]MCF8353348.1 nucleotide exchange factor GrpE [Melioribacteraceae bacterium]MCF8393212.1 nucleotide exchange factor GrpE [Melioribacteraceae bacterium]MCF8419074.1 nucleotide exchange factor GrpE [Melioribacteraceae bacterium]
MKKENKKEMDEEMKETKETDNLEQESEDISEKNQNNKVEVEKEGEDIEAKDLDVNDKIESLHKEIALLNDSLLRKVAEFENYKRRSESEQINLIKYAAEPFIKSVLGVYDDLGRSISHIGDEKSIDGVKSGLKLVYDKFTKVLSEQGVKRIESKGEPFDFNLHEALMQQEADDVPAHTVIQEIEPGYLYKDKVIRHAKVIVSQESAASENEEAKSDDDSGNEKE